MGKRILKKRSNTRTVEAYACVCRTCSCPCVCSCIGVINKVSLTNNTSNSGYNTDDVLDRTSSNSSK